MTDFDRKEVEWSVQELADHGFTLASAKMQSCLKEIDRLQEQVAKMKPAYNLAMEGGEEETVVFPVALIPGYDTYRRACWNASASALGPVEWMLSEIERLKAELIAATEDTLIDYSYMSKAAKWEEKTP